MANYLNMLGLANRAGKLVLGEGAIIEHIRSQRVKLVLIASDASPNTHKKLTDKCRTYHIPFELVDDRDTLSHAIGKEGRVAVGISDAGFSKRIIEMLRE